MPDLHRDAVVVDCHNDLPVMLPEHHRRWGRADHFASWAIPELRAGGVDVQVLPVYTEPEVAEAALRHVLLTIERLHADIAANGDQVALCLTGADIDAAIAGRRIALVLALEGCAAIGADVELFSTLFRLGVRMASFTHFPRTLLGDGSAEEATGGRLPSSGVAAVWEMERLGMLVDVSHLSAGGTEHVLEIATRPVIASHSSARALRDHHRNLSDAHLHGIAATGGVAGVNVIPLFIDDDAQAATLDRVVDHIEHMVAVAGVDHVGLGPDFIKDYYDDLYPHLDIVAPLEGINLKQAIPGLAGSRDLPNLTEAMLRRGLPEETVRKILGENFLRVFREVIGVSGGTSNGINA
jgi:membrane dipeptidase